MEDSAFEHLSARFAQRYFLIKRSSAYYFLGGAVAVVFTIFGVSIAGLNSRIDALFEAEAGAQIAKLRRDLFADVEALEADIANARALASERASVARSDGNRILYEADTPPTTMAPRTAGMAVVLKGRMDGRATSIPVNQAHFVELCGDMDGCTVEIAVYPRAGGSIDGRSFLDVQRSGGKCTVFYEERSGIWSLSDPCMVWTRRLTNQSGTLIDPGDTGGQLQGFSPYVPSASAGVDGLRSDRYQATAIMGYANWCFLSQSPEDANAPGLVEDTEKGFHLLMAGTDWAGYREQFFPSRDSTRYCLLLIDD
ncbi:MAG: hypothetical protein AAF744_00090 [Pseudomonadota bacterium]